MRRSVRYAGAVGGAYALLAGLYIAVSSRLAADTATDVEDLATAETTKGLLFVAVTSAGLFALTYWLFRRVTEGERRWARSREALRLAEQRATPGLLAASVAHDLRNMLMVALTAGEVLRREAPAAHEIVDDLEEALTRAVSLAQRLSRAGRGEAGGARRATVRDQVAECLDLLEHLPAARSRRIERDLEAGAPRSLYPALLDQVVVNLFVNALDATAEGGRIRVRVRGEGENALLEVHDDGPGFPEGVPLGEPFVTTKEHGTGLGLLSVRECALAHGGDVELGRSDELRGARVRVRIGSAEVLDPGAVD